MRQGAAIAAPLAITASAIMAVIGVELPGGIAPSYRAVDYDFRLSSVAREAGVFIQAINLYYALHGECPEAGAPDFEKLLAPFSPTVSVVQRGQLLVIRASARGAEWFYVQNQVDRRRCRLSRKLGWDPTLVWQRLSGGTTWIFVPGDGSPDIPILLDAGR